MASFRGQAGWAKSTSARGNSTGIPPDQVNKAGELTYLIQITKTSVLAHFLMKYLSLKIMYKALYFLNIEENVFQRTKYLCKFHSFPTSRMKHFLEQRQLEELAVS